MAHMRIDKTWSEKIVDFLLTKPFHFAISATMMSCAVTLHRDAFVIHVFGVTFFLLVVLHKINMCYGKMKNPFQMYEQIVIAGGAVHCFVPIVGLFYPVTMLVHTGICFSVHILHLMQCYQVFNDMKMKDTQYILILWFVNIAEFITNLAFIFPAIISDEMFVVFLVVVEISAQLISSLKLSRNSMGNTSTEQALEGEKDWLEKVSDFCTTRIFILLVCSVTAGLLVAFHKTHGFSFFILGFTVVTQISIAKFHSKVRGEIAEFLFWSTQIFSFLSLPTIAFLSTSSVIDNQIGVLIILICSIPMVGMLLYLGWIVLGHHFAYHAGIVFCICYVASNVLFAVEHNSSAYEVIECISLASGMILCLNDNKQRKVTRKNGYIHPSESVTQSTVGTSRRAKRVESRDDSSYQENDVVVKVYPAVSATMTCATEHHEMSPEVATHTNSHIDLV